MSQNLSNIEHSLNLETYGYTIHGSRHVSIDITTIADYALSLILMAFSSPIFIISAAWVTMVDFGNPFFIQRRIGLNGRPFRIVKLRTMRRKMKFDSAQFCRKGDNRIIFGGNFLRKSRIDEIPQFLNIILGDMALVGPRPEQEAFVEEFKSSIQHYDLRHQHKPGITGLAQIRLGYVDNHHGTRKKLKYDLLYIKKRNIRTWLFIVLNTISVVIRQAGR